MAIGSWLVACLTLSSTAFAQSIDVKAPAQVSVGQRFQVSWTINGNGSDLSLPQIKEFSILGGPNQSQSVSIVNGSMSQSLAYAYVLQADKEGDFTIGPAKANFNGKMISSKSVTIKVVKGQAQPQQQAQGKTQQSSGGSGVFAKIEVNKRSVDLGEALYAECKIYSKSQLIHLENYKLPEYTGFWSKDLDMPQQLVVENESVDGVAYQVVSIKKTLLYPTKAGKLEIDPMSVDVIVRESSGRQRSIFDMFGGYQDIRKSANSGKVVIDVRDLPAAGKPANFSGLTGKFTLDVSSDRTAVKAGDAITLKVTIGGDGNLLQVQNPQFTIPPDMEAYDPKVSDKIATKTTGLSGSRTFEYVVIPRYAGDFEIGPFTFSYYDPTADRYVTLSKPAMAIKVEKGDGTTDAVAPTMNIADKRDIQIIGSDIRYIKQGQYSLRPANEHFYLSPLWWVLMLLPILAGSGAVAYHMHRERQASDVAGSKSRKAKAMAVKRMDAARKLMKANDQKGFYEAVMKALFEYVSHRFHLPVSELDRQNIQTVLDQRQVPDEVAKALIKVLDEAEFARFAPGAAVPMEAMYNGSLEAIIKMEDHA